MCRPEFRPRIRTISSVSSSASFESGKAWPERGPGSRDAQRVIDPTGGPV
jgi:hypothetical protein